MINNEDIQETTKKEDILKDTSNNNDLFEIKRNDDNNIQFGNKLYRLTEPEEDIPDFHRNFIFVIFLLSNLFLNYDTGVIPASLIEITKEIHLDYSEQALIGSLVYLGLSFSSIFVSLIFTKFGPSKVCSIIL